jgi:hypothetical protein
MATVTGADTYFTTHLDKATWEAAGDTSKANVIETASLEINSLPLRRNIADELKDKAIYEQAVFRLKYSDKRENLQVQGVKSISISGGASEFYAQSVFGVPLAPRAKLLLTGWFALGAVV